MHGLYAGLLRRFFSYMIDVVFYLLLALALFGTYIFICLIGFYNIPQMEEIHMIFILLGFCLFLIIVLSIMEFNFGATFGKIIFNIRIGSFRTNRNLFLRLILRNILKIAPFYFLSIISIELFFSVDMTVNFTNLVCFMIFTLIHILFLFRKDHRGFHDLAAKTIVVAIH